MKLGSGSNSIPLAASETIEVMQSHNFLSPEKPYRILLPGSGTFNPGDRLELAVQLHAESVGDQELHLLFVYREVSPLVGPPYLFSPAIQGGVRSIPDCPG